MAKRSPILGYNHNVRYRGLVFHVQTEDSGVLSPHLFTHLFYEGVIVSTRKLVYDAGANEEAIKALMQAQHKAVMKDLKRGAFDDKIDQYLGGTPGLEPRAERPSGDVPLQTPPRGERAVTEVTEPLELIEPSNEVPAEVTIQPPRRQAASTPPAAAAAIDHVLPLEPPLAKPRTQTADRTSRTAQPRFAPPVPAADEIDAPTLSDDTASIAAAIAAANTAGTTAPPPVHRAGPPGGTLRGLEPAHARGHEPIAGAARAPNAGRAGTPPPVPQRPQTPPAGAAAVARVGSASSPGRLAVPAPRPAHDLQLESSPEISISIDDDEDSGRNRGLRDTSVEAAIEPGASISDGIPSRRAESVPPTTRTERPPSHDAAALPPMTRPPSRPMIARPRADQSQPIAREELSQPVEIHSPAPPSVEPPPGERAGRPGQYSVSRKQSDVPMREQTGRLEKSVPSAPPAVPRARSASERPTAAVRSPQDSGAMRTIPQAAPPQNHTPPARAPAPTMSPRAATPPPAGSGVVMTRPAVIVGAPAKPPQPPAAAQSQKIRKAREDEGRGFGQGLISEKSLDEVILAYLSEDEHEK